MRTPIHDVIQQSKHSRATIKYELKELSTPILMGKSLRYMTHFSYSILGQNTLVKSIISKSNLDLFDGEYISEPPSFFPPFTLTTPVKDNIDEINLQILNDKVTSFSHSKDRIVYNTTADYYKAYKAGQCTPVDVAKFVLDSILSSNQRSPPLRAVVMTDKEYTMNLAEESAKRWKEGQPLSLIDGVPITIKSELNKDPFLLNPGTCFKTICGDIQEDAIVVTRLINMGAILVGQTNMQEYGTGVIGSNPNKEFLTPCNPYNDKCYCGGSSSGSAASVAAGLCPISIGADGGGSIRVPASLCGIVGLKPTYHLLDTTGFMPQSVTVGVGGPLCSSTLDAAIAMSIMCPGGVDLEGFGREDLKGIKVGVYKEYFEHADPEIVTSCKKALDVMLSLGAVVVDIVIPELEEVRIAHMITITSEMANAIMVEIDKNFDKVVPETLLPISAGLNSSAVGYINSQKQRTRSIRVLESIFKQVDIIATPTNGVPAPFIPPGAEECGYGNGQLAARLMRYSPLANLTGIPGISLPVGQTTKDGLPIGLQFMGPWFSEGMLLTVAYALEKRLSQVMSKPSIYYDVLGTI